MSTIAFFYLDGCAGKLRSTPFPPFIATQPGRFLSNVSLRLNDPNKHSRLFPEDQNLRQKTARCEGSPLRPKDQAQLRQEAPSNTHDTIRRQERLVNKHNYLETGLFHIFAGPLDKASSNRVYLLLINSDHCDGDLSGFAIQHSLLERHSHPPR